jgi:hypothetical protein
MPLHHVSHEAGGIDAIKLDLLAAPDDNTKLNVTAAAHGLAPKLSGKPGDVFTGAGAYVPFGSNIPSGTLAQQPTGLTAAHAGALYQVLAPYWHTVRWDGAAWQFAPGDCGNGYFTHRPFAPQEPGWALCNGVATDYLVMGASLTASAFTPPAVAGAYLKAASLYNGILVGAVIPTLIGSLAAAGAHGHTGATDAAGAAAPTASAVAAGAHVHTGSATDSQGSHGHTFTTNGVGNHTHGGITGDAGDHGHNFGIHVLSGTESAGTMNVDAGQSGAMSRGLHQHGVDHDGTTDSQGRHNHTLSDNAAGSHAHTGGTDAAGAHAHNVTIVSDGSHTHTISVSAIAAHAHNITATAVGDHVHGNGTLAVSGSGEPAHLDTLVYFRR